MLTKCVRRSYDEIVENNKRAFLFRDVAWVHLHVPFVSSISASTDRYFRLELYFSDKRNFLIVFKDKKERQAVVQRLQYKNDARDTISRSVIGNFVLDQVSRAMDKAEQQLEAMTRRWQNREISNVSGSRIPIWGPSLIMYVIVCVPAATQPARQSNAQWFVSSKRLRCCANADPASRRDAIPRLPMGGRRLRIGRTGSHQRVDVPGFVAAHGRSHAGEEGSSRRAVPRHRRRGREALVRGFPGSQFGLELTGNPP